MNSKIAVIVALSCAGAFASPTNYDLLGRKGSKMNSPMVYKNVDYSKNKKANPQISTSTETRSLAKKGPGIKGNYVALTGAYNSLGFDCAGATSQHPYPYYLKRYKSSGNPIEGYYDALTHGEPDEGTDNESGTYGYISRANKAFISVPISQNYQPNYLQGNGWTNVNQSQYTLSRDAANFDNPVQSSPYARHGEIRYIPFEGMKTLWSQRYSISWYDYPSGNAASAWGKVGIHMVADALPVQIDWSKSFPYLRHNNNEQFTPPTPDDEVLSSRIYNILNSATNNSAIYVGKSNPTNPASYSSSKPQIYIGVHSGKDPYNPDEDMQLYGTEAIELDNYIYDKRTMEFVAAGNYNVRYNDGHVSRQGHAANAVTVGAIDAYTGERTGYTSTNSYFCGANITNQSGAKYCPSGYGRYYHNHKPEIYNFSHFYMNDQKRTYSTPTYDLVFNPYYDGTEMAAAYTASMVAELMTANAFYRWHPEVVKALLLTSSKASTVAGAPAYSSMMPEQGNPYAIVHESRYWIGDMSKLMGTGNTKEVTFAVKNPSNASRFTAAISWLNRGSDIARLGDFPQHFRLLSRPSRYTTPDPEYHNPLHANEPRQNFQILTNDVYSNYTLFTIQFMDNEDRSNADDRGQIVLGFDVAFY